jgi:succinate dehydrogenase / fumarate reductase cytochrome b subunit
MTAALTLYRSTIGKKVVMALSGLVLIGFVILHMWGNLHIFEGPEKFNEYAVFLRTVGAPLLGHEQALWLVRIVLLGSVVLHTVAAYQLTRLDLASRPVRYARHRTVQQTFSSRTMRWGGLIILLFVIYHILHFTLGTAHPNFRHGDVYSNVVVGFQNWLVSGFYIAAMVLLGLHLYHGTWSMFQTLGLNSAKSNRLWQAVAAVVALAVAGGNILVPLAVLAGFVRLPGA